MTAAAEAAPEPLSNEPTIVTENALAALTRSEIATQIDIAKRYPRSLAKFRKEAMQMACLDEETAESCYYVLKRKKREGGEALIEGPSIRCAEIAAAAWGNLRWGARTISDDGKVITAQGYCHDLETNVARVTEIKRRITDRNGRRYSDDMIAVTANAACAIAGRNALVGVIPRAYVDQVWRASKQVVAGATQSLAQARENAVLYFERLGISREQILAALERPGIEDVTREDVATLRGIKTAIRDGQSTLEEAFPPIVAAGAEAKVGGAAAGGDESKAAALARELKGKPAAEAAPADTAREPGSDDNR